MTATPETHPGDPAFDPDTVALVVAVQGPTAVGKTAVAERLALRLGGEIVSADAMQVYRRLDIGTAKPDPGDRPVPYHCIDLVDPGEEYSAALFQRDARRAIVAIARRERIPILVGGTGLYVRAALDDLRFPEGDLKSPERVRLERLAEDIGAQAMHRLLAEHDPDSAAAIHPNNVRRTIRALEMAGQGVSYAERSGRFSERRSVVPVLHVALRMERETLYGRIDRRVDEMLERGLLEEVRSLLADGFREALTATQAIGYKELVPVLEGSTPLEEAVERIKRASRRYAKRQLTWLHADPRLQWVDADERSAPEMVSLIEAMVDSTRNRGGT